MNDEQMVKHLYDRFNARDMNGVLSPVAGDVAWANGREAVRAYWPHQWSVLDPHVKPLNISAALDGSAVVEVHQTVHDLQGKLLLDELVVHVFRIEGGPVVRFDIRSASQLSAIKY